MDASGTNIMTLRDWSAQRLAMTFDKGAAVAALKDIGGSLPQAALQIAGDPFPFWREAYKRRVFGGEAERVTLEQLIELRDVRDKVLYQSSLRRTGCKFILMSFGTKTLPRLAAFSGFWRSDGST